VARRSSKRQVVLTGPDARGGPSPATLPLGTLRDVRETLARYNTGPDGAPQTGGTERLYGPGMVVEIAASAEVVQQALATINDEDTALPVLMRLCKEQRWRLVDVESGRVFG